MTAIRPGVQLPKLCVHTTAIGRTQAWITVSRRKYIGRQYRPEQSGGTKENLSPEDIRPESRYLRRYDEFNDPFARRTGLRPGTGLPALGKQSKEEKSKKNYQLLKPAWDHS